MFRQIMDIVGPSVLLGTSIVVLSTAITIGAGLEIIVFSSLFCASGLIQLLMNIYNITKKNKK